MLRIALPNKGRLSEDARDLFNDAGLEVRGRGERSLTASLGGEFEAIFVRAADIPEFVADGAAQAGITGLDLVRESGRPVDELLNLEFGRCRLVVAVRDESHIRSITGLRDTPRVATVFPRVTARYFADAGIPVDIVPVSGAAEIAPHLGIADIVVDLTSTGSTLKVNGLIEIATVLESSARLVTSVSPTDPRREQLDDLVDALGSVLRARSRRYLMANVPRARLAEVQAILPGISGPTVIDIMDHPETVAVHAVVAAATIYRTVGQLKQLGGQGILVTRIERLMP
jgi:ATP phosphoribosyltransferase